MSNNWLKKNKYNVIAAGVIVALALLIYFGTPYALKVYYFVTAPKFSAIHYVRTEADYGCLRVITDASCATVYNYKASGGEKEIVMGLVADLKKRGYELSPEHVTCDNSEGYDLYVFQKPDVRHSHPARMDVLAYPPTTAASPGKSDFGCVNAAGAYRFELLTTPAQD